FGMDCLYDWRSQRRKFTHHDHFDGHPDPHHSLWRGTKSSRSKRRGINGVTPCHSSHLYLLDTAGCLCHVLHPNACLSFALVNGAMVERWKSAESLSCSIFNGDW